MTIQLSGSASTGNDTADALAATYPPSLFGLPGSKPITGDQVLKAYQYIAESGSPIWATIRKGLLDAGQYGKLSAAQKADVAKYNWTKSDKSGVLEAITNFHIYNSQAPAPVPFTEIMEFFKEAPFLPQAGNKRGLPDIFDPKWVVAIDKNARALCSPLRYSKDLIGYFTDNEIGFGKADDFGLDPGFQAGQFDFSLLRLVLG